MCGRYSVTSSVDDLVEAFDVREATDLPFGLPRYNIAPTQVAPVIVAGPAGRRMGPLRWGLVPFWADDPAMGNRLINARCETAHVKAAFREAFRRRRCLVPADGFYEWKRPAGARSPRTPYWIHREDGEPFALAGLWERWVDPSGVALLTYTILTIRAAPWMEALHDRMPVILRAGDWDRWLSRDTSVDEARSVLDARDDEALVVREVSTRVNKPTNDDPLCIEPAA